MGKIELKLKYIGSHVSTSLQIEAGTSVSLYQNVWTKVAIEVEYLIELIDREQLFEIKPFNFNVIIKVPDRIRKKRFEIGFDGACFYKTEVGRHIKGNKKDKDKIILNIHDLANLEFYKA